MLWCAAWLGASAAHGQPFEQFTPTPAGDWSLGVESGGIETTGVATALVVDYACDPLVLRSERDWFASLAAGPGLTGAAGVPLFRVLLGLCHAPE